MKKIEEIKKILEVHKEELRRGYGIKEIGIFGSYVRGEETKDSDLDLLVGRRDKDGAFRVYKGGESTR